MERLKTLVCDTPYLNESIVKQGFELGKTHYLDKLYCGVGGSTSYIYSEPNPLKIKFLIVPNLGVLEDKKREYQDLIYRSRRKQLKDFERVIKMKFLSKDSEDFLTDKRDCDVVVVVADSFLKLQKRLRANRHLIESVLIDEVHAQKQQSSFRKYIRRLTDKVRDIVGEETPICMMTATPLINDKPTIQVEYKTKRPMNVSLRNDFSGAILEIKDLISKGKRVIVGTNNANIIKALADENLVLKANLIVGVNLMQNLCELVEIKEDINSKLHILSSRGFEGLSIYADGEDVHSYLFENRNRKHESFYIQNLYQFFSRCRTFKSNKLNYIRTDRNELREFPIRSKNPIKSVEKWVNNSKYSVEEKQSAKDKTFKIMQRFVEFDNHAKSKIFIDYDTLNCSLESYLYDDFLSEKFDQFKKDRSITIYDNRTNPAPKRKSIRRKIKAKSKEDYLLLNSAFIVKYDLFGNDYFFDALYKFKDETIEQHVENVIKGFYKHIRRKNFNRLYVPTKRQLKALEILENENIRKSLLKELVKTNTETYSKKYCKRVAAEKISAFKNNCDPVFIELIQGLFNDTVFFKSKEVAHRRYGVVTALSYPAIKKVFKVFGLATIETDIVSCFIRILYALCGLELPKDIYGENKKNKLALNVWLNSFFGVVGSDGVYRVKGLQSSVKQQRYIAKKKFKEFNIDERVVDFLLTNFLEAKHKGDLFNLLALHEKLLLKSVINQFLGDTELSYFRRHDSFICFLDENIQYPNSEMVQFNKIEYLGQKGWFNAPTKKNMVKELIPNIAKILHNSNDLLNGSLRKPA